MTTSDEHPDRALLVRAGTDPKAERILVARLRTFIIAPVRVCLRRWPGKQIAGQDEEDLASMIQLRLFDEDAKALKNWDETRGSLGNYVSLFTRNRLKELERKELRRLELVPSTVPLEKIAEPAGAYAGPDELAAASELARLIRRCLMSKMRGKKAQRMISLFYDRNLSTDEIVDETGMTRAQVSRWRHDIRTTARGCLEQIRDKG